MMCSTVDGFKICGDTYKVKETIRANLCWGETRALIGGGGGGGLNIHILIRVLPTNFF